MYPYFYDKRKPARETAEPKNEYAAQYENFYRERTPRGAPEPRPGERRGYYWDKPAGGPPGYTPKREGAPGPADPGAIRAHIGGYVYIWTDKGGSFWMYPTYAGRSYVSGYRWTPAGWVYAGLDFGRIDGFAPAGKPFTHGTTA